MANCPMCGEAWNEQRCGSCDWQEGKRTRYTTPRRDRRKSGEGAMKGWATRRRKAEDRRVAMDALIEVADSLTSELVVGARIADRPGKFLVGAITLVKWRDRIVSAVRILEPVKLRVEVTREWCESAAKAEEAAGDPDCTAGVGEGR